LAVHPNSNLKRALLLHAGTGSRPLPDATLIRSSKRNADPCLLDETFCCGDIRTAQGALQKLSNQLPMAENGFLFRFDGDGFAHRHFIRQRSMVLLGTAFFRRFDNRFEVDISCGNQCSPSLYQVR
jgi:hypothetical protein